MPVIPNWADLDTLKGPMYLNLTSADAVRDAELVKLGQGVTDEMIDYLSNPAIDSTAPSRQLQKACLKQCCYEWKQRATPGLQSVQMQDGSINKYQVSEWLKEVEGVLRRAARIALYETNL